MRCLTAACAMALALAGFTSWASASEMTEAAVQSRSSGKPLLVIGVTTTCPQCRALEQNLKAPAIQKILSQFVGVRIVEGTKDWKMWQSTRKGSYNGVPQIFITTPRGEDVLFVGGNPQGNGLEQYLSTGLKQYEEFKKAAEKLTKAQSFLAKKNTAAAVAIVASHTVAEKPQRLSNSSLLYPAGNLLVRLNAELTARGEAEVAKLGKGLKPNESSLLRLVSLIAVRRSYGELPSVKEKLAKLLGDLQADEKGKTLVAQAELLDAGDAHKAAGKPDEALKSYETVIKDHPDTKAALLAKQRADRISKKTPGAAAEEGEKKPAEVAAAKKAASQLRMAKLYAKMNPDKAKQFAQNILDTMPPDSPEALEAKKLLEELAQ